MPSTEPHGWSLRTRLLWQLVLAFGLLLGGLFLALDVLVDRAMLHQLDQVLAARAASLAQQLQDEADPHRAVLPAWDIAGHTEFFAVFDGNGTLRMASLNSGTHPLRIPAGQRRDGFGNSRLPDGHNGRYRQVTLRHGAFAGGRLLVATERESWDSTGREMHRVLVTGLVLAIVAAVLLCLLLLRQAFAYMAREAERLPHDGPPQGALPDTPVELRPFVQAAHDALRTSWAMAERERRFSRSVAHELRTPVAEIGAASERALAQNDPQALRHGLLQARQAGARMQRGIEALLALARFESGQELPQSDPLDLAALLRQQAATFGPDRIHLRIPAEAWVISDAGMLERITANLLLNALEYGDAGGSVQVQLHQVNAGVEVEVCNRASRLTPQDIAHFGERHWRGERDGDVRHAGLGLALVNAMAQALGLQVGFVLEAGELRARLGILRQV
ncbi:ATP-binding protein [Thermomonas sp.]|uniref:sensor histidine kinase n=1 Tax=Thermomonas sp. TaxID=1971895 RepID=UPI00261368B9|nr:ATP-binding protein [Thermomonas sp.]MCO5056081.1 ATP-binding protein [Thermomonas sp.]HRO62682.1 histidine kinase dimerization/phospho-acceptor domain-containing protein [Thermomonas sp.]